MSMPSSLDDTFAGPRTPSALVGAQRPQIELCDADGMALLEADWVDLAGRALEPNVFLAPAFALTLARHLPRPERPTFVTAWLPGRDGAARLVGVCPLAPGRRRQTVARAWRHELMALGIPLLDRDEAAQALAAILDAVGRDRHAPALLFDIVPEGRTLDLMRDVAEATRRPLRVLDPRRRAILTREPGAPVAGLPAVSAGRRSKLKRQRRKLGPDAIFVVTCRDGLPKAFERFLNLEASGWKGRRGTALACTSAAAAFAGAMADRMAARDDLSIASLERAGAPIAMAIVLRHGDRDFVWKIAYDEGLAAFSPGAQLMLDVTARFLTSSGATAIDSCALPDHPMIDRLWPERLGLVDVAIGAGAGRRRAFDLALCWEVVRRRARATLKRAILAVAGRLRRHRPETS